MTRTVLIHGGSFAASCWDLVLPHLGEPALAVDLPGRGSHPADLDGVGIDMAAASVVSDIDAAGVDEVVLVGHSLAGTTMPGVIRLLGDRVRRAVFVACTVPEDGTSAFDTLDEAVQRGQVDFRQAFGNDLDDAQWEWCQSIQVPEAMRLVTDPVDLSPLRRWSGTRMWIRPTRDAIVDPANQLRFAANVGNCEMVDLDAGHMCMISAPAALARLIEGR